MKIEVVGAVGAVAAAIARVMLSRMAIAFTARARHGGYTGVVVAHGARHRGPGEVRQVRTRTIAAMVWQEVLSEDISPACSMTSRQLSKDHVLRTVNGGHAKRFCVGVLEIIETSKRVVGEVRALEGV